MRLQRRTCELSSTTDAVSPQTSPRTEISPICTTRRVLTPRKFSRVTKLLAQNRRRWQCRQDETGRLPRPRSSSIHHCATGNAGRRLQLRQQSRSRDHSSKHQRAAPRTQSSDARRVRRAKRPIQCGRDITHARSTIERTSIWSVDHGYRRNIEARLQQTNLVAQLSVHHRVKSQHELIKQEYAVFDRERHVESDSQLQTPGHLVKDLTT